MAQKNSPKSKPKKGWGKSFLLILLLVAIGAGLVYGAQVLINRSSQTGIGEKTVELSGLQLYSVQEFDYNSTYSYYLNYPKVDQAAFDDTAKNIAERAKDSFLNQINVQSGSGKKGDLTVSYDINFYNDQFLSVDLFMYQTVGGKVDEREDTILYDRDQQKVLTINDLFKPDSNYLSQLSSLSRTKLQQLLGSDYNAMRVNTGTQANDINFQHFTIDDQQNLVLVFEEGQVAPKERGAITVKIGANELATVLKQPLGENLFKVAAQKPALPQAPKPNPTSPISGPVPQADPSGVNCAVAKCIALTFDDGPSYTTPRLLDILKANNVKATFFELGIQAQKYPSITQRVVNEGHVIGNHTWDHKDLELMPLIDAQGEVGRAADTIQTVSGVRPGLVRAPYGAINNTLAQQIGAPFINWSVDPDDWRDRDADIVYNRVMSNAKAGDIVLSHDIYQTTVDAYERIVPDLIRQGYTLVTVPQLLGFGPSPAPGVYFSQR